MGRAPCCDKNNVKRGPWSPDEDVILKSYVESYGTGGNWIALPKKAGLQRCGKSCRLRWLNYLRPDIKHGGFTDEEDEIICNLYNEIGSRWSVIASRLPGRTDNDVKNYWNTKLKKKLLACGNYPVDLGLINEPQQVNHEPTYNNRSIGYYGRTGNNVRPEICSISSLSRDYSVTSISNSSPAITAMDSTSSPSFGRSTEDSGFFIDHGMEQMWDFVNELLFEDEPLVETPSRFHQPRFPSANPQSFINQQMNL